MPIDFTNILFIGEDPSLYLNLEGQPEREWWYVVLHDMEAPEAHTTAESVGKWLSKPHGVVSSVHYCVDDDSIVQLVQLRDVAYGAKGGNRHGIQIEHAGYARQSRAEWLDEFSVNTLLNSAELLAKVILPKTRLPIEFLAAADLLKGKRGITTHAEISKAFFPSGHSDPGPNFPMAGYIDAVWTLSTHGDREAARQALVRAA